MGKGAGVDGIEVSRKEEAGREEASVCRSRGGVGKVRGEGDASKCVQERLRVRVWRKEISARALADRTLSKAPAARGVCASLGGWVTAW